MPGGLRPPPSTARPRVSGQLDDAGHLPEGAVLGELARVEATPCAASSAQNRE